MIFNINISTLFYSGTLVFILNWVWDTAQVPKLTTTVPCKGEQVVRQSMQTNLTGMWVPTNEYWGKTFMLKFVIHFRAAEYQGSVTLLCQTVCVFYILICVHQYTLQKGWINVNKFYPGIMELFICQKCILIIWFLQILDTIYSF